MTLVAGSRLLPSSRSRDEEEGEYEWASYHSDGGKEQAHAEPAVLYTPLGGGNEDDGFEDEWRRIVTEYGSRCEQYGGHWKGHKCVGVRHHGHPSACIVEAGKGAAGGAIGGAILRGAGSAEGAAVGAVGGCIVGVIKEVL